MTPRERAIGVVCQLCGEPPPPGAAEQGIAVIERAITEAVAAERERCAEIARAEERRALVAGRSNGARSALEIIAAIRARTG